MQITGDSWLDKLQGQNIAEGLWPYKFGAYARVCVMLHSGTATRRRSVAVSGVGLINEVNRHWARLVLGWVTVCGRVNHLGM